MRRLDNGLRAVVIQDKDVAIAAACANVQAGYFDDPPSLPGLAHFLEHAVHLGSEAYPDEKEYKAFLAQHGGSSNASTNMVHTQYHLRVAAHHLDGALSRLGAMLAAPLICPEAAAREVENVHSEYSRNCNSDSRKLLQLRRSLGRPPFSQFSTGSIATLRDTPAEAGVDVAAEMRALWRRAYLAPATTVAVVGPQAPSDLEGWVREAFGAMDASRGDCADTAGAEEGQASGRYGVLDVYGEEQRGALLRVAPMRDLRSLELSWFVPYGALAHQESKPWRAVGHALGHESCGSAAHLLKRQGLIQSLSAGMGEEVRLGRGFMFWRIDVQLTEEGETHVPHVLGTIARAIQLLRAASTEDLRTLHQEAAALAALRFDWRDPPEPLSAAKDAAYNLHYYPAEALLAGPALIGAFDEAAARGFVELLEPGLAQVAWSSRRWVGAATNKERWYGADYSIGPLDSEMSDAIAAYCAADADVTAGAATKLPRASGLAASDDGGAGQRQTGAGAGAGAGGNAAADGQEGTAGDGGVHMPRLRSISLPGGLPSAVSHDAERPQQQEQQQQGQQQQEGGQGGAAAAPGPWPPRVGELRLPGASWGIPRDLTLRAPRGAAPDWRAALALVVDESGLSCWHKLDTSFGLPKARAGGAAWVARLAHVKLHLLTPAAYETPAAVVATRLLLRIVEDLLLPDVYVAETAGTHYSLEALQSGVKLAASGFPDVLTELLPRVLGALAGLSLRQVEERFPTMAGRLRQALTNWRRNNPGQHAEYAAEHALQARHHHVEDLLDALSRATPADVLLAARRLAPFAAAGGGGGGGCGPEGQLHVDMLVYGNLTAEEAAALAGAARAALRPGGLHPCLWTRGRVVDLSPSVWPLEARDWLRRPLATAEQQQAKQQQQQQQQAGGAGGVLGADAAWVGGGRALEGGRRGVSVTYRPANPNPANKNHAIYYLLQIGPDDVRQQVMLDLFTQSASRPCFHELRTRQRLGYSVSLHASTLQRIVALAVRVQSPGTDPAGLGERIGAWLAAFRGQLEGMPQEELDNHKRALQDRYLEPPKSLRDAAARAWRPIERRSLDWARRQHKADAAAAVIREDLLAFYDRHLSEGAPGYRQLSAEIWGGGSLEAMEAGAAAGGTGAQTVGVAEAGGTGEVRFEFEVGEGQLAAFKLSQPLWPAAAVASPGH